MHRFLRICRESIRYQELVLLSFVVGGILMCIPFQKTMALSHYQHYDFAVFTVATGFLLQATVSWRSLSKWGRGSLLGSAIYLFVFGYIMWTNTWLDRSVADLETEFQSTLRAQYATMFSSFGIPLAVMWYQWSKERRRALKTFQQQSKVQTEAVS